MATIWRTSPCLVNWSKKFSIYCKYQAGEKNTTNQDEASGQNPGTGKVQKADQDLKPEQTLLSTTWSKGALKDPPSLEGILEDGITSYTKAT